MNWVAGCAVFTIVVGMVLSALEIVPNDFFQRPGEDPAVADQSGATPTPPQLSPPAGPVETKAESGLEPDRPAYGFDDALPNEMQESVRLPDVDDSLGADASPIVAISSEQRTKERAIEALRIGDAKALRETITLVDALLAGPQAPQWAPAIRQRLLDRLERGQFARLP